MFPGPGVGQNGIICRVDPPPPKNFKNRLLMTFGGKQSGFSSLEQRNFRGKTALSG